MLLSSPERVLRLMGAQPLGDSVESAEASLEVASETISIALDTSLVKANRQDYFSYLPSKYETSYTPLYLLLHQGFLRGTPNVYLSADGAIPTTETGSALSLNEGFTYDAEKGVITLMAQPYRGNSLILVEYAAGFVDEDDVSLPPWLIQAGLKEAISQMQSSVIGYNRKDMRDKSGFLDRAARRLLDGHQRPRIGLFPENSTVIA
jgi:hypothetical protein